MNYSIPLSYKLDIRDLIHNNDNISNEIQINNFKLFVNKKYLIYKIQSNISLEFLLDFLFNYEEIIIKKIYYYLIIKFLITKKINIRYEYNLSCFSEEWFDIYLKTRNYHICYNDKIIITDYINFNICLIINNNTINKSFITIIDKNSIIDCLYELIDNNIYNNKNYEEIQITLIGGSIDNVNLIINIYIILKKLKLSKFINKTYLFKNKPLNRLKFNTYKNKINFISNNSYCDCITYDNSDHINNPNYYSNLIKCT
jgi:hypothetical protein